MRHSFLVTGLCMFLALPVAAQEPAQPVQQNNSNSVWFDNWIGLSDAMLRVASPDGEISDVTSKRGSPIFVLKGRRIEDGIYRYELRAATEEMVKNRDYVKDGTLGNDEEFLPKQLYRTGYFQVERGVIIAPQDIEEEVAD